MGIVVDELKTPPMNVKSDTHVMEWHAHSMQRLERDSGYRRVIPMRWEFLPS